jgi:hypothetical protein
MRIYFAMLVMVYQPRCRSNVERIGRSSEVLLRRQLYLPKMLIENHSLLAILVMVDTNCVGREARTSFWKLHAASEVLLTFEMNTAHILLT